MINFASLFKQYRNNPPTNLADLLATPSTPLIRLLEDDNFISEFKSATARVKQYMTYMKFDELVVLVTEVGDPLDKKRSFKFPLSSCELLTSDCNMLIDYLLPQEGVVYEEERVVTSEEQEIEEEVDDEDEDIQIENKQQNTDSKQGNAQVGSNIQTGKTEEEDQEFGDFVAAPPSKKKIIKLKQVVETVTISKKEHPSLINKLFDLFEKEINYTLTGYVCKILTSLLNKRNNKFLAKLFSEKRYTDNILNHIESRSTVQLVVRICTLQSKQFLDERLAFYKSLIKRLSIPSEVQVLSNISAAACEVYEKISTHLKTLNPCKQLSIYIDSISEFLQIAAENIVAEDENVSVYSVPFVFQLLNSLPSQSDQTIIDQILVKLAQGSSNKIQKSIQQSRARLGIGRVKMIEVISNIYKRRVIRQWAAKKVNFFSMLLSLVRLYPLNNILHNQVFKIISSSLTPETPQLTQSLFINDRLIIWLQEQAKQQEQRLINGRKNPKGYAGHLVNLCKQLRENAGNNILIRQIISDDRYLKIVAVLVEKQVINSEKNLGGFILRKSTKHLIMFSKQDILQTHAVFLSSAAPSVFESDPDDPLQNPAILQELKRQLDGCEMQDSSRSIETKEEESHKRQLIDQNDNHKSAFWKVHLQFDVEDLLDDL